MGPGRRRSGIPTVGSGQLTFTRLRILLRPLELQMFATLMFYMPGINFRRVAKRLLREYFPADMAMAIWRRTQAHRIELKRKRPRHSLGVNLIVRYLEWDCALYRSLLEHGLPNDRAGEMLEALNWEIFRGPVKAGFKATRLRSSNLRTRVRWLNDLLFRFLFARPFRRNVLETDDSVAYDVVACPFADYFRQVESPELTRYAVCNLDYHMARTWGIRLDRTQTIAEGGEKCDFRFVGFDLRGRVGQGRGETKFKRP